MDCDAPNYHAQMHDVNNELFAEKSKMNIVLEPRDKHIIVLMMNLYKRAIKTYVDMQRHICTRNEFSGIAIA